MVEHQAGVTSGGKMKRGVWFDQAGVTSGGEESVIDHMLVPRLAVR